MGDISPNPHGCPRQGKATGACIHNGIGLIVSIMRLIDTIESQTVGYQPMMACHRGETETPMPISGIVRESVVCEHVFSAAWVCMAMVCGAVVCGDVVSRILGCGAVVYLHKIACRASQGGGGGMNFFDDVFHFFRLTPIFGLFKF